MIKLFAFTALASILAWYVIGGTSGANTLMTTIKTNPVSQITSAMEGCEEGQTRSTTGIAFQSRTVGKISATASKLRLQSASGKSSLELLTKNLSYMCN